MIGVGAIGHRDLAGADIAALRASAEALFAALRRHADAAGGVAARLRCISNAAEGADTLLGEAALAAGLDLVCLLPVPRAVYEDDSSGEAARAAHRRLLLAAATIEEPAPGTRAGPDAYLAAARRLLARSALVVTVWDGKPERGVGGTGQTVREARRAGLPVLVIDPRPPHRVRALGAEAPGVPEPVRILLARDFDIGAAVVGT